MNFNPSRPAPVAYTNPMSAFVQMEWPRKPLGKGGPGKSSHGMAKGGKGKSKISRNKKRGGY